MVAGKILIIHQGAIGDLILSLPAIKGLQEHFQHYTFYFMGYPPILELMAVDKEQVITVQMQGFSSLYKTEPDPPENIRQYLKQFEKVIVFGKKGDEILVKGMKMIGVKDVFRIDTFPYQNIHVTDYQSSILLSERIVVKYRVPRLLITDEERELARQVFIGQGVSGDEPLIFIHPGSGSNKKIWPLSFYARLAEHLQNNMSARIALIEGPADKAQADKVHAQLKEDGTIRIKMLPLRTLAALIKQGKCFIGNDSGITHLSAAVGIPTVALFGPTNPAVWGPRGEKVHILQGRSDCSPCDQKMMRECARQRCLEDISVDEVYHTVKKALLRF